MNDLAIQEEHEEIRNEAQKELLDKIVVILLNDMNVPSESIVKMRAKISIN